MDEDKVKKLEAALAIIQDEIDSDLYDWLLDWTDARPGDTEFFLSNLISGIKEANRDYTPTLSLK